MIAPREQWAVQIDVTSACPRRCSNCTRPAVGHTKWPFFMPVEEFVRALEALRPFVDQGRDRLGRQRVIGMIGGEPMCHPDFPELVRAMAGILPPQGRGFWTGMRWEQSEHADLIRETFHQGGYINRNLHHEQCYHQPVLVAPRDVVADEAERRALIDACPLQQEWASAVTPKGFFFCEVAAGLDMVFNGPGGARVEPGVWQLELDAFRWQIDTWCQRCGVCLPLQGRLDKEMRDDVSPTNLEELRRLGSPRIAEGRFVLYSGGLKDGAWAPLRYLRQEA
jgi:hypothetical protein